MIYLDMGDPYDPERQAPKENDFLRPGYPSDRNFFSALHTANHIQFFPMSRHTTCIYTNTQYVTPLSNTLYILNARLICTHGRNKTLNRKLHTLISTYVNAASGPRPTNVYILHLETANRKNWMD